MKLPYHSFSKRIDRCINNVATFALLGYYELAHIYLAEMHFCLEQAGWSEFEFENEYIKHIDEGWWSCRN